MPSLWYCIYTKPNKADYAGISLNGMGIEVYNPKYRKKSRINGRVKVIERQLFPNYIFARFFLDTHYRNVKYARGMYTARVEIAGEFLRRAT